MTRNEIADQGHHHSQFNLGVMYAQGGESQLSFKFYKLSADQGFAGVQFNVGNGYANGTGVERSDSEACKYFINYM